MSREPVTHDVAADATARSASDAMTRYARGDDAAFAVVYDALAPRLYAFLLRQTRAVDRAEDVLQQTFLQMHRARGHFVPGAEVTPWAFAIARRLVIDRFRRGKREVLASPRADDEHGADSSRSGSEAVADGPRADDLVQAQELADAIRRELAKLPEGQRVAFELVKQEGLSLAEAAQVLGVTVTAVKLRAHRAYEALRLALGERVGHLEERGT